MKVFTDKQRIVELKHFQYSSHNYQLLLEIQRAAPNAPLEIETNGVEKKFVSACEIDLENHRTILTLNGHDACISK